ncbi:hypothetical protein [Kutzneria albida]|uniref:Secreted protein n=1 Tax=Kutzneria albida DSM 43870 TaxID=1449976 RepID=W5WSW0_9PSEU|nr:hypothetical protein [Kutzneria albida]AHI01240.1 hypothetical protein KALB_7882 [Kutzneria albida DSM 43870]
MGKWFAVLVALALCAPGTATASARPACSFTFPAHGVSAVCDLPSYQVVAACVNDQGQWSALGTRATSGRRSTASCGRGKVVDYTVQVPTRAAALPPGCAREERFGVPDGEGVRAYCEGNYRVVAHCTSLLSDYWVRGTVTGPGRGPSEAVCHASLLSDYYVEIV